MDFSNFSPIQQGKKTASSGAVTFLTARQASGWACHPSLHDYPVTLNVILKGQVVRSLLADAFPPKSETKFDRNWWFHINLHWLKLTDAMLGDLSFIVGETDEHLPTPLPFITEDVLRLEDILALNMTRSWVTGATYHDALKAGRSNADVIDLLYRDLLGRPADPSGLADYLDHLNKGSHNFDAIRCSLLGSKESMKLQRNVSEAPGAIFSLRIISHVDSCTNDYVVNALPRPLSLSSKENETQHGPLAVLPSAPEFTIGWHSLENEGEKTWRWMGLVGTILNPLPGRSVFSIMLRVQTTHDRRPPLLRCFLDGQTAVSWADSHAGRDTTIYIECKPEGERFTALRLESVLAGSPSEKKTSRDTRTLSLLVTMVVFTYVGDYAELPLLEG